MASQTRKIKGKGYRRGTQARLGFLPGKYTDFMFASIAEEFGFAGSFLILTAYFMIAILVIDPMPNRNFSTVNTFSVY